MKSRKIVSGAMIVAAGVSATSDRVSAAGAEPQTEQQRLTETGLNFDMVKLDDDVLRLGGFAQETGPFGAHGDTGGFRTDGEELYLAQTVFGGSGNDGVFLSGAKRLTVINPNNNRSMTVLYNSKTRTFFNPQTGVKINPPNWLKQQVQK